MTLRYQLLTEFKCKKSGSKKDVTILNILNSGKSQDPHLLPFCKMHYAPVICNHGSRTLVNSMETFHPYKPSTVGTNSL